MTDSTDNAITYKRIRDRAMQDAKDAAPALPTTNTVDAWQAFIDELEAMDASDIGHQFAEWDWVIYHYRAMELCQCVPSAVLHEAESQYEGYGNDTPSGLFEYASTLAFTIVAQEIADAVDTLREELLELANNQLDIMESV
jgi:hypothetical protein